MVYLTTMESLGLNFQVNRSNGLAVVTIWCDEISSHLLAKLVIHRKCVPNICLMCPTRIFNGRRRMPALLFQQMDILQVCGWLEAGNNCTLLRKKNQIWDIFYLTLCLELQEKLKFNEFLVCISCYWAEDWVWKSKLSNLGKSILVFANFPGMYCTFAENRGEQLYWLVEFQPQPSFNFSGILLPYYSMSCIFLCLDDFLEPPWIFLVLRNSVRFSDFSWTISFVLRLGLNDYFILLCFHFPGLHLVFRHVSWHFHNTGKTIPNSCIAPPPVILSVIESPLGA